MATKNSMTPSGGIFQSHQGVPHGFGNPDGRSQLGSLIEFGRSPYMGRERLEQFGETIMLHVPGARTPVRQDPREYMGFLGELAFRRRTPERTQLQPAFIPGRTQLPQPPQAAQPPHQPMH